MVDNVHYRVRRLEEALQKEGVAPEVAAQILGDGATLRGDCTPEAQIEWVTGAMGRMDELLDAPTRQAARIRCACCLGGKRGKLSRAIGQEHATLDERVRAANATPFVFGHSVTQTEDGGFVVSFQPEGWQSYRCSCLKGAAEPISITYCYCCGGHVKHHLRRALGCELTVEVISSALASAGQERCSFLLRPVE